MQKITFYTKLDCHLCDEAYRLLMDIAYDIPLNIDVVDVTYTGNREIATQYATRVPVLARPDAETELAWPFTSDEVRAYLAS